MVDHILVNFYRIWHGTFGFKGAGALLKILAPRITGLHFYRLYLPDGTMIEVDFRDVSALFWVNDLLGDEFQEQGLVAAILPFLTGKEIVWDIGANSGLLSYHLLKSSKMCELHLFEPNPKMHHLASQVVALYPKALVHAFGMSDQNAEFTLTIPTGHTTMGTLEANATVRNGTEYKVSCCVGDQLVSADGFRPPQIIKIDTEGHELRVIAGLSDIITRHRPIIFFEHISLKMENIKAIIPTGYSLYTVVNTTGELVGGDRWDLGHNCAMIPVEKEN